MFFFFTLPHSQRCYNPVMLYWTQTLTLNTPPAGCSTKTHQSGFPVAMKHPSRTQNHISVTVCTICPTAEIPLSCSWVKAPCPVQFHGSLLMLSNVCANRQTQCWLDRFGRWSRWWKYKPGRKIRKTVLYTTPPESFKQCTSDTWRYWYHRCTSFIMNIWTLLLRIQTK